jgi:hypothetical protein
MAELSRSIGLPIDLLVQKNLTGQNHQHGTWVHPRVAVHLAQWCSARFAVLVSEWVLNWMTKGQAPVKPTRDRVYVTRLSLACRMQMGVPEGYWTVFDKCSNLLILVECDLGLPVEKYDLLDGSVGTHWAKYREGKLWAGERVPYRHIFPDKRGVQSAWAYLLQELPHFERWLRGVYMVHHLPAYLKSKYELSLPIERRLAQMLGLHKLQSPQN